MLILLKILLLATVSYSCALAEQSEKKSFLLNFEQNDYKLNVERIELINYKKEYVEDAKVKTFKYNRTCTAFNISVILNVDLGTDGEVIFQAYRFASNEYRLFPMRFQINLCEALSANVLGTANANKCGNFTGCPIKKGNKYTVCNFTPDPSKFPPLIPSGKYMYQIQILYRSVEIVLANAYCEIYRPFTGK